MMSGRKDELTDKEKQKEAEQSLEQKKQQLIMDVFGQVFEPLCTFYRCRHKFLLHGSIRCRGKHPTNRTLGISMRYP